MHRLFDKRKETTTRRHLPGCTGYANDSVYYKKIAYIKRLLLLLFTGTGVFGLQAQNPEKGLPDFRERIATRISASSGALQKNTPREGFSLALVPPQTGTYRLAPDNMPCMIPDSTATVTMPNVWKGSTGVPFGSPARPIPNPARPLIIRPVKPLRTTPEFK